MLQAIYAIYEVRDDLCDPQDPSMQGALFIHLMMAPHSNPSLSERWNTFYTTTTQYTDHKPPVAEFCFKASNYVQVASELARRGLW